MTNPSHCQPDGVLDAPGLFPILSAAVPAALVALTGLWAGTVAGGASAAGAIAGQAALLAAAVGAAWAGGLGGWDPLGLGRRGRVLPAALWIAAAASLYASAVPRAGRVGVALLPAFLLLPALTARVWAGKRARKWGTRAVAAVVAVGAGWSLIDRLVLGSPRVAAPIGHHGLLAVWLLALAPLAMRAAGPRTGTPGARWLDRGWRGIAVAAVGLAAAALAAGRSLAGLAGLAVEVGLLVLWLGREVGRRERSTALARASAGFPVEARRPEETGGRTSRRPLIPLAVAAFVAVLGLAVVQGPRLGDVLAGTDPSQRARWVYTAAGWRGFLARPVLGWGPGATPWTLAEFLRPVPGVNPPGEVVGEMHSLPLRLLYELGGTGTLLAFALVVLFVRRRVAGLAGGADPVLARAGVIALAGAGTALLGTAWLEVTALPVALAVAAGAVLAGAEVTLRDAGRGADPSPFGPRTAGTEPGRFKSVAGRGGRGLVGAGYALVAIAVLFPLGRAQLAYDRAVVAAAAGDDPHHHLARAVRLDPAFPLYRAWWSWTLDAPPAEVARESRRAAEEARALAPLWLAAGVYAADAGQPAESAAALDRACTLDPLGAFPPFYRAVLDPRSPAAPAHAARALLAAPELAAATFWEQHPDLLRAAAGLVRRWPGVDPGFRDTLADTLATLDLIPAGPTARLALRTDPAGDLSFTLRAFRRLPQPFRLVPVEVRPARIPDLPSAARLLPTSPDAFSAPGRGLPPFLP